MTRLVLVVVLCGAAHAVAGPRLLGDDAPRAPRQGWLLAQAPGPSSVQAELFAIDKRIAELTSARPTSGRIVAGVVLTALGGPLTIAGAVIMAVSLSAGGWAGLIAILVGLPATVLGLGLLIPGLVLWLGGMSGRAEVDEELSRLRARRGQLLGPQAPAPAPPTPEEPAYVPQVWVRPPAPALTLARF